MKKLAVLFSHRQLTEDQLNDASESLNVKPEQVLYLPEELQNIFSNIPPELESIEGLVSPLKSWVRQELQPNDYVMIQGDFGLVVSIVDFCRENGYKAIYSTTLRQVVMEDGSGKKISIFKHVRYRNY